MFLSSVSALRPACQQVYNLFHPADPSASRLEPLLDRRFHLLPPFSVPRYQRFPLGDGLSALLGESSCTHEAFYCSFTSVTLSYMWMSVCCLCGFLVETVQSNPQLLMEAAGAASHRCQENTVSETSIPVPVLNWPTTQLHTESVYLLAFVSVYLLSLLFVSFSLLVFVFLQMILTYLKGNSGLFQPNFIYIL